MNILIIIAVIVGLLFATTYFTKRRFGVLGLALCAGFLLSTVWTNDVVLFIEGAGIELLTPPLSSVVAVSLIILPAIVLLFSGPTYSKRWQRLVGATAFSLLATSFILTPLGQNLSFDATGQLIYDTLVDSRNLIITSAVLYALYDLLILKTPKLKEKGK